MSGQAAELTQQLSTDTDYQNGRTMIHWATSMGHTGLSPDRRHAWTDALIAIVDTWRQGCRATDLTCHDTVHIEFSATPDGEQDSAVLCAVRNPDGSIDIAGSTALAAELLAAVLDGESTGRLPAPDGYP